jgi:hypothetical protein
MFPFKLLQNAQRFLRIPWQLMKQRIKCAKCGMLLAEITKKGSAKRTMVSYAQSLRFEIRVRGKEAAWSVCTCGKATPFDPALLLRGK